MPAVEQKGRQFDLPYRMEQWNDADTHVEELIALTGDYRVARAAYEEAIKRLARTHCCVEAENESVS